MSNEMDEKYIEEFAAAWNGSDSIDGFLERFSRPMKASSAKSTASYIRRVKGIFLKRMPKNEKQRDGNMEIAISKKSVIARQIEEIRQSGDKQESIMDIIRIAVSALYAQEVIRSHERQAAHWEKEYHALFDKFTAHINENNN